MKNSLKTVLSVLALTAACCTSQATGIYTISAPINNPANGHNYYVLSQGTWDNAEAYAQTMGGHLATIRNAAENSWIFQNITSQQSNLNPWFGWNDADGNGV